ncbi:MAG: tetraacyldisaccharide 4'-kinase [Alphaproteobacteria bacterium]|nr:tetraacyldisaccharide 4'-kinase [Alphaproteobacteria bacterium]MCL2504652.1 tetraacyldisaccharide 4'-kinase [Alphaproteobacteria bacterium]
MKTPKFWYDDSGGRVSKVLSCLLLPVSWCFALGTKLRRMAVMPYRASVPVICVGNLTAGGAGKTPTAIALAEILSANGEKPVFVSKGYKGKGVLTRVDAEVHSAQEVGDEALLLARIAPTWVADDIVSALKEAELNGTVVIVDDGFQNPGIKFTFSVLVIDGMVGIGNGRIIPAGPLREQVRDALNRADAVVIVGDSKSRKINLDTKLPIFRAHFDPKLPMGFPRYGKFLAFSGIARPEKFKDSLLREGLNIVKNVGFPDHYMYTKRNIKRLRTQADKLEAVLITTEKDFVRLSEELREKIFVFPVKLVFDNSGTEKTLIELIRSIRS